MAVETSKILVYGASKVGKTTLISQYLNGWYDPIYEATSDVIYLHTQNVNEKHVHFLIHDTAAYSGYPSLNKRHIETADAFVLVYSLTCKDSFNAVGKILAEIESGGKADAPMIVVGNDGGACRKERAITREEGEALANGWGCSYMEITRELQSDVEAVFLYMAYRMLRIEQNEKEPKMNTRRERGSCIIM